MRIDAHVHLIGTAHQGCHLHRRFLKSFTFRYLKKKLGLETIQDDALGPAYLQSLLRDLEHTPQLDALLLLAMDSRYDAHGKQDLDHTTLYVPNDYLFSVCRDDPRLLPAASINPARRDALEALEEAAERGAVCIKTLPNTQGFDPANPAYRPWFRRMAELSLPWLTHTGREHTLATVDQAFGDPERLIPALEEGVTVIAAHAGTAGIATGGATFARFCQLLERFPNLHGDTAALTNLSRAAYLQRILAQEKIWSRLHYGSDYPVPSSPMRFAFAYGWRTGRTVKQRGNLLSTSIHILEALGAPDAIFTRAAQLLRLPPRSGA